MTRLLPLPSLSLPPIPALLLSMLSIQGGAAIAKGLFPLLGPAGVTTLRVGLSALVLLIVFRPNLLALNWRQWRAAALYGATLGLMNLTFYASLHFIPLGLAVTLEFLGPLGVAVFSSKRRADLIWVALAGLGIFLMTPLGGGHPIPPLGLLLALAAASLWAAYIVIGARLPRHFSGTQGVSVGMLWAALTVLPFGLLLGDLGGNLSPGVLLYGLGVALLSSALPYSLEMVALRQLPKQVFSIMMSLEPAVAAVLGWLVLQEVLSVSQWLAIACVIAASAGASWGARRGEVGVQV